MSDADLDQLPPAVLNFRPNCPGCTPQKAIDPEGKPCSFYACPGLPDQLRVTCDECMYDFAHDEGQMKCDHSTCEIALKLKGNLPTYRAWIDLIAAEMEALAQSR